MQVFYDIYSFEIILQSQPTFFQEDFQNNTFGCETISPDSWLLATNDLTTQVFDTDCFVKPGYRDILTKKTFVVFLIRLFCNYLSSFFYYLLQHLVA